MKTYLFTLSKYFNGSIWYFTNISAWYRKTSDSSRVPYTSRAPNTGRGFKWIVPIEAGSRLHAGSRVQAGSGCKSGESWYLLTYRSQPVLTSANMANWRRLTCTDRSRVPDTGRGLKWIVPIEAGGFYPRFYGSCFRYCSRSNRGFEWYTRSDWWRRRIRRCGSGLLTRVWAQNRACWIATSRLSQASRRQADSLSSSRTSASPRRYTTAGVVVRKCAVYEFKKI